MQCARAVVIACVLPGVNARQLKRSELFRIKRHGRVFPRRIWCQVTDIVDGSTDLVAVLIVQREGDTHIGQLLTGRIFDRAVDALTAVIRAAFRGFCDGLQLVIAELGNRVSVFRGLRFDSSGRAGRFVFVPAAAGNRGNHDDRAQGKQDKLYLGNLSSLRDWGYAKDYVECMWLILQQEKPEDFVIATGVQHSVREFCYYAFKHAGIELEFQGEGLDEKGIDKATGRVLVEVSEDFYRPTDVVNLWGDPTKAKSKLGWDPMQKTTFEQLVAIMVKHDMEQVAAEHVAQVMRVNLAEYLEKGLVK